MKRKPCGEGPIPKEPLLETRAIAVCFDHDVARRADPVSYSLISLVGSCVKEGTQ